MTNQQPNQISRVDANAPNLQDELVRAVGEMQNAHVLHATHMGTLEQGTINVRNDVGEVKGMLAQMATSLATLQSNMANHVPRHGPEDNRDVHMPTGSEADACQAHYPSDHSNTSGLIEKFTHKTWTSISLGFPQYKTGATTWIDYCNKVRTYLTSQGILADNPRNAVLLIATTYTQLDSTAAARASMLLPENCTGVMFPDYLRRLGALFDPPLHSYELTETYHARKQGNAEDARAFMTSKRALFQRCTPNWQLVEQSNWVAVREHVLSCLANPTVQRETNLSACRNWTELESRVIELTAAAQSAIRLGCSLDNNTAGLAYSSTYVNASLMTDVTAGRLPVREVNNVDMPVNQVQVRPHRPQNGQNQRVPRVSRLRVCWDCGRKDHLRTDPKCTEKGSGKYLPEYIKNRSLPSGRRPESSGQRQPVGVHQVMPDPSLASMDGGDQAAFLEDGPMNLYPP